MSSIKMIGIVVCVIGVALLLVGISSSHSLADQVTNTFLGRFTQATTWYLIGGVAVFVLGLVMMIGGPRGKSA